MADSLHEYDLGDMVGSGSSAQVYWAHRVSNGELVAIKVLDKMQHALIRRQSRSMSKATGIQEIEVQQKRACVHPCYQPKHVRRVPLDERRAQHYIRQLVAGIAYIHGQNVLHRDLKLSNILLTSDDVVKIADFGLATDLVTNQSPSTICGTPNFIAPEVLLGKAYTFSADLWSLGCMAYSLLVGTPPFQGQTVAYEYILIVLSLFPTFG
ncbi:hypothetical protein DYB34_000572 [Aphanomyces astaci]|uniref:Protein kinase domain-containing protein n=1 Tax=Aphanomyces astaci TaxID=112090 RepID=A0A3R6ZS34_APHAT|nr:hypothetical protein DYB34_000572 [Aphanomyces astaci]